MEYDLNRVLVIKLSSKKLDMIAIELDAGLVQSIKSGEIGEGDMSVFVRNMFFIKDDKAYRLFCSLNDFTYIMNYYRNLKKQPGGYGVDYDGKISKVLKPVWSALHLPFKEAFIGLLKVTSTITGEPLMRELSNDEACHIFGGQSFDAKLWQGGFDKIDFDRIKQFRLFKMPSAFYPADQVKCEYIYDPVYAF